MDRLEAMSVIVAVTETGSFSAASRRLKTPVATVSRKVAELEARDVDLGDRYRYEILAFSADELSVRDVLAEVLSNLASDDVPESRMVLVDLEAHRASSY